MAKRRRKRGGVDRGGQGSPGRQPASRQTTPDEPAPSAATAPAAPPPMTSPGDAGQPSVGGGMPSMPASNMPVPMFDEGYARGGLVRPPAGFFNHPPSSKRGYAGGGFVDPMGYLPDRMINPPLRYSDFDEANAIGRDTPMVSPIYAAATETGYAAGGPIPGRTAFTLPAAAQVPAYTDPVYPAPSARNAQLYADMDALRAKTVNRAPAQMPASMGGSAVPSAAPSGGSPSIDYSRLTGTVVNPPSSSYNPNQPQGYKQGDDPWQTPFGRMFDESVNSRWPLSRTFIEPKGYQGGGNVRLPSLDMYQDRQAVENMIREDNRRQNLLELDERNKRLMADPRYVHVRGGPGGFGQGGGGSYEETGYAAGGPVRGYADGGTVDDYGMGARSNYNVGAQAAEAERRRQAEIAAEQAAERQRAEEQQRVVDQQVAERSARQQPQPTQDQPQDIRPQAATGFGDQRPEPGQQTGYNAPPTAAETQGFKLPSLSQVMDYLHNQFSPISSAAAAAAEVPPAPATGYGAGGYGGELTAPPPANALQAAEQAPPPATARPLSLQSTATPSISGQDTQRTPEVPPSSDLGRLRAEPQQPVPEGIGGKLLALPGAIIAGRQEAMAKRDLFQGTDWAPQRWWKAADRGLDSLLRGDKPYTVKEMSDALGQISEDPMGMAPRANTMVQSAYDNALKTGGPDAAAAAIQQVRPGFNNYLGLAQAGLAMGSWEHTTKALTSALNLMPNDMKYDIAQATDGKGGWILTAQPEKPGADKPYSLRLSHQDIFDMTTGPTMQFDNVAKGGLEGALRRLVATPTTPGAAEPVSTQDPRLAGTTPVTRPIDPVTGKPAAAPPNNLPAGWAGVPLSGMAGEGNRRSEPRTTDQGPYRVGDRDRAEVVTGPEGATTLPAVTDREAAAPVNRDVTSSQLPAQRPPASLGDIPLRAQDPRSIAARADFTTRTAPAPAAGAPLTQDQQALVEQAKGNFTGARQSVIANYNRLVEDTKPRPIAPAVHDARRDPGTMTNWGTQESSSQGSSVSVSKGGSSRSQQSAQSSASTPHTTTIPGAPSQYVPNAALERAEAERQARAVQALKDYGPAPWERPGWHTDDTKPLPHTVFQTGQVAQGAAPAQIPPTAVQELVLNPTPARIRSFEKEFGPGMAARILGNRALQ